MSGLSATVTVVGGFPGFSTECVHDWHRDCIYSRCSCECHQQRPPITARQRQIMHAIEEHVHRHGYGPSLRELAASVGLRSADTVAYHLQVLVDRGLVTKAPGKARALGIGCRSDAR